MLVVEPVVEKILDHQSQGVLVEVVPVVVKVIHPHHREVNMLYMEQVPVAVAAVELMAQVQMLAKVETARWKSSY